MKKRYLILRDQEERNFLLLKTEKKIYFYEIEDLKEFQKNLLKKVKEKTFSLKDILLIDVFKTEKFLSQIYVYLLEKNDLKKVSRFLFDQEIDQEFEISNMIRFVVF